MKNEIKIGVATHKKINLATNDDAYKLIQVGSEKADERFDFCEHDDDIEDNISYKNPNYCELTALYYLWKSCTKEKYIGLVHYRRFFVKNINNDLNNDILTTSDIKKLLKGYKVILPLTSIKPIKAGARLYKKENKEVQDEHWLLIEEIVKSDYPNMMKAFEKCVYGRKMIYGNMMIMEKEDFNDYCQWLFEILNKIDNLMEKRNIKIVPRMDGYLSEQLLNIWCQSRYKEKNIRRLPVRNIETNGRGLPYISNGINKFLNEIKINIRYLTLLIKYHMKKGR